MNILYNHLIEASSKLKTTAETTPFIYRLRTTKVGTDKSTTVEMTPFIYIDNRTTEVVTTQGKDIYNNVLYFVNK